VTLTNDTSHGYAFDNVFDLAAAWRVETNLDPAPAYDLDARIDHLFVSDNGYTWTVSDWVADLTVYGANDRYPSDHFAIAATLEHAP
jgi:hypothetical protein